MADKLHLYCFGSPQFIYRDKSVTGFVSNKARALLIYLAVTAPKRHLAHSRDALAELLWADTSASKRANLKRVLSNLRSLDGVRLIEQGQHLVAIDPECCWVDVTEFVQTASSVSPNCIEILKGASQLYQSDFLSGFNYSLSDEFEAWALAQQTQLKEQLVHLLQQLADSYAQHNDLVHATTTMRRLIQLEPWREEAHRRLIELLALNNDVSAALTHFDLCRAQLREELEAEPSAATLDLVAKIRAGAFQGITPIPRTPSQRAAQPVAQQQIITTVEFPLVGRAREWQVVQAIWQNLNQPQFLCISAEAGLGKTRLAEELLLLAEQAGTPVARARSHALHGQLAYGPITDWLRTPPLQAVLARLDQVWLTELTRLLPELPVDHPTLAPPQPLREGWQRRRFFDALCHAFTAVEAPLLLVFDDLQWSDGDTLEWIQYLVDSAVDKLLVVGTVRTEEIDAAHPLHHIRQQLERNNRFTELPLAPLTAPAITALATQVAQQQLADDRAEQLMRETAGNPLFVIETMRATSETAVATPLPPQPADNTGQEKRFMPAKIYSVIQARLAQLSPEAHSLAQVGATIGRSFDVNLLAKSAGLDEDAVLTALDELWQRRVINDVDAVRFDFSHDRIRDVAYAEISPLQRRRLHRAVAEALVVIHGDDFGAVSGDLATHYAAAGSLEEAITYYQHAADGAGAIFAHQKAIKYRQRALDILHQLPRNRENRRAEVDLLLALITDETNAYGLGYPSIYQQIQAAHELAQEFGTPIQQLNALIALTGYALVRGEWNRAEALSNRFFAAAVELGDPKLLAHAHFTVASIQIRRGNLAEACTHYEHNPLISSDNSPHGNTGPLMRYAYCLWLLGFPAQGLWQMARALEFRRKYEDDKVQISLHQCSSIALFCGDVATVDRLSAELVELATQRQDDFSLRWGMIYQGWLLVQQGQLDEGIQIMRENANEHRARENYFYECVWRSLLAEAYVLAADFDAALDEIDSTLAYAETSGDCHWNAQLLKLRGDCLQAATASDVEVERHYQLAIDTARGQTARSLELRATTSLCRLWQRQGKVTEAHQLLSDIYGWFTEGFDTTDLVEAKALLCDLERQLSRSASGGDD